MDRERSPAYAALPKTARRMLGVIEKAAVGGSAAITFASFMADHHFGRPSISGGLKALDALGWIDITPGPRSGNVFRLSNRWRTISEADAKRLVREAGAPMRQRRHERRREPVQPVQEIETVETPPMLMIETNEPPPVRRPSMPTLAWLR
jgi:hypothetical protein